MLILDTNVLSALMSTRPAPDVETWIEAQNPDDLYTTAVSQAEVMSGLAVMDAGKRRKALEAEAKRLFAEDFAGRVLPFDCEAVAAYAENLCSQGAGRQANIETGFDDRCHCQVPQRDGRHARCRRV